MGAKASCPNRFCFLYCLARVTTRCWEHISWDFSTNGTINAIWTSLIQCSLGNQHEPLPLLHGLARGQELSVLSL